MGLMNTFKKKVGDIVDKVKDKVENIKEDSEQNKKLIDWQNKFTTAKSNYDTSIMDDRELMYLGKRDVDPNVNKPTIKGSPKKKANNVVNVIYEFIESQVDTTIPQPSVKSKLSGKDDLAQVIEDSIKNDLLESEIYRINDENERTTPLQGFSIVTVNWNPDFKHHLYRGEIEIDNRHPKTLIPQPGIFDINKMDYIFLMSSETKGFVKRRYKKDVSNESEEYPDINNLDNQDNPDNENNKVTVITAFYKDEDNDICKFTWCNDITLEDYPKYYYRRDDKGNIIETETLEFDVTKSDGTVIPKGTQINYFAPTRFPIIVRKNVPIAFNFGGQSDCDAIRDQADCIKKIITKVESKIIDSGSIIKMPDNQSIKVTNEIYKVIRGNLADLQQISVMDIQSNIGQDLAFAQEQYKAAQNTLGITDSFQGKPDPTAKSGVAKQIQVYQSSGRMQSKLFNKRTSYKELFETMFEFKLAFYDEPRAYTAKGTNNTDVYGKFNRYDFLEQDAAGEWYYNTDFVFTADAGDGLPKDKVWLMNEAKEAAAKNLIDKIQYWTIMEKLGFPGAGEIKKQAEEEKQMAMQMQQMQLQQQQQQNQAKQYEEQAKQYLQSLTPEEQQQFNSMSSEEQQQHVSQVLQGGDNNG